MRILKTSDITTGIAMPFKAGSLDHIQLAYKEAIAESVKGLVGSGYNAGVMYILNGLVNSGTYPTYTITAGSVFFDGEVYLVDAAGFTLGGGQVAVCKIVTTQFTGTSADGVQFNDGITRNVHQIRKVVLSADLGGSGISNYVDGQRITTNLPQVNVTGSGIATQTGSFPNFNINVNNTNKILASRKIFLGDLGSVPADPYTSILAGSNGTLSAYVHTFPVPMPNANYWIGIQFGNEGHNDWGGFNDNYMCCAQAGFHTNTQFWFAINTTAGSAVQAAELRYIIISLD